MHGHGEKPHLCSYEGCDRSVPGNGFPRRWNLYDHMKRVHDYKGPSSTGSTSPAASPVSGHASNVQLQASRKRKGASSVDAHVVKRSKSVSSRDSRPSTPAMAVHLEALQTEEVRHLKEMEDQWAHRISTLQGQLNVLQDPQDISGHEHLRAQMASLQSLATEIRRLSPQQSTSEAYRYDRG
ncbi:hypothetical protein L228DRAFT_121156 [Xylona heveae TC161]|uniref:C2H2-domain containing protein second zinc finger domain-containing protein n=1 Tax=Xylona heveae (strain CBS 132557 / TC161) TaxID=1328760 RepID=A0A165HK02_XYLHT|nr:hypothetical protein L228DRAFT_121156 [Xylona heveae TC161]KZF23629.1 hypothetical protein L228DRAFT_121156 [Xylona heveae TC161]